ncbi:hypothetical protein PG994_006900 [Apiospora phragmitis]|uniref:Uncharacterized protein n=1 Tax=Apiospora phragmitis TaxID=2905665 RepID=A0ABR1VGE1_9PEZI
MTPVSNATRGNPRGFEETRSVGFELVQVIMKHKIHCLEQVGAPVLNDSTDSVMRKTALHTVLVLYLSLKSRSYKTRASTRMSVYDYYKTMSKDSPSRCGGIPIDHLAGAAVKKKLRLVCALHQQLRKPPKPQEVPARPGLGGCTPHHEAGPPASPWQPRPEHDGHGEIIDTHTSGRARAWPSYARIRNRQDGRGLLARAVFDM